MLERVNEKTREVLAAHEYSETSDIVPADIFGPLSQTGECFELPADLRVEWIGTEDDIHRLDLLLAEKIIGVDCEWRPAFSKFDFTPPSILQLGGNEVVFIVDMLSLSKSSALDNKLTEIFTNPSSTVVAFGFETDLLKFETELPHL